MDQVADLLPHPSPHPNAKRPHTMLAMMQKSLQPLIAGARGVQAALLGDDGYAHQGAVTGGGVLSNAGGPQRDQRLLADFTGPHHELDADLLPCEGGWVLLDVLPVRRKLHRKLPSLPAAKGASCESSALCRWVGSLGLAYRSRVSLRRVDGSWSVPFVLRAAHRRSCAAVLLLTLQCGNGDAQRPGARCIPERPLPP